MEHQKQDFDIQPSMPRRAGRQQNRANPDVQTVSDHYRVTLYNVFLDHLVQEMETCILGNEERYCAQHLLPSKLAELRNNMLPCPDLPQTYETFTWEFSRWIVRWSMTDIKTLGHPSIDAQGLVSLHLYCHRGPFDHATDVGHM